ncbi:MAG: PRTRC system protein E [Candidatus Angelobacter sp.]
MFTELQSLLAKRSLTITVAALGDEQIRVNVIPHPRAEDAKVNEQIKYSHKDEMAPIPDAAIKALTTPISLTGTTEEIDAKLSSVLLQFVESHTQLQATFDRASTEISAAVKAIDERNKNKPKTKAAGSKAKPKEDPKTKPDDGKSKPEETLPLWWTDSSVQPPGASAATHTPPATATQAEGSQSAAQSSNVQEVSQPCR